MARRQTQTLAFYLAFSLAFFPIGTLAGTNITFRTGSHVRKNYVGVPLYVEHSERNTHHPNQRIFVTYVIFTQGIDS